jgi:hypothetical protein
VCKIMKMSAVKNKALAVPCSPAMIEKMNCAIMQCGVTVLYVGTSATLLDP